MVFNLPRKHIKAIILGALLLGLILSISLYGRQLLSASIILILIIFACISKAYKHFTGMSIGFELVTVVTILFAYKIGMLFAILAAGLMLIVSEIISGKLNAYSISIQFGIYILISILASLSNYFGIGIVTIGIILVIMRSVLMFIAVSIFAGVNFFRAGLSLIPNIFINVYLILKLAEFVVKFI